MMKMKTWKFKLWQLIIRKKEGKLLVSFGLFIHKTIKTQLFLGIFKTPLMRFV